MMPSLSTIRVDVDNGVKSVDCAVLFQCAATALRSCTPAASVSGMSSTGRDDVSATTPRTTSPVSATAMPSVVLYASTGCSRKAHTTRRRTPSISTNVVRMRPTG